MAPAKRQPMTARPRRVGGAQASTSVYAPGTAVGERLAYAYGDLATGTTMYACHDQLGSVRRWRTPSKGNWGANEFEPYGEAYAVSSLAPRDYALHEWDPALAVYRAPYRNYSPTMTRWTTRDPLGMIDGPNMYGYVGGRTTHSWDSYGLESWPGGGGSWQYPPPGIPLPPVPMPAPPPLCIMDELACLLAAELAYIAATQALGAACAIARQGCHWATSREARSACEEAVSSLCSAADQSIENNYEAMRAKCESIVP